MNALVPRSAVASSPVVRGARSPGPITPRPKARHGLDTDQTHLHIGPAAYALAAVRAYEIHGTRERDYATGFATMAVFSVVAAILFFGVVEIGWRLNWLLGGTLFGLVALTAMAEMMSARRQTLVTITIEMMDGRKAAFVTASETEARAVCAALDATAELPVPSRRPPA